MIKAPVIRIIHHSLVDGPGNRTSVFLQGCNLRCEYCHNPETQKIVRYSENLALPPDSEIKWMSPGEVFQEIKTDIPFIRGITVSGGECMLYPDFMKELFVLCQEAGLSCLIDTNGTLDMELYPGLLEAATGVMLDIKAWDKDKFHLITGGSNENVKKNLKFLADQDKLEEVRIVCIPNQVDAEAILSGIKDTIGNKINRFNLKLIRFRNHGVTGKFKDTDSPSDDYMDNLEVKAKEMGFTVIKTI